MEDLDKWLGMNKDNKDPEVKFSRLILGAGKIDSSDLQDPNYDFSVFVDRIYSGGSSNSVEEIEKAYIQLLEKGTEYSLFCGQDIFNFLDTYKFKFDMVFADRVAEHMFFDSGQIGRFLDACNQITYPDGNLCLIVPDLDKIIEKYIKIKEVTYSSPTELNSLVLLLNTEMQNTVTDCHGSCWSRSLAKYYIENEGGTWIIDSIENLPMFKGRDIYMRIICSKPKLEPEKIKD